MSIRWFVMIVGCLFVEVVSGGLVWVFFGCGWLFFCGEGFGFCVFFVV